MSECLQTPPQHPEPSQHHPCLTSVPRAPGLSTEMASGGPALEVATEGDPENLSSKSSMQPARLALKLFFS